MRNNNKHGKHTTLKIKSNFSKKKGRAKSGLKIILSMAMPLIVIAMFLVCYIMLYENVFIYESQSTNKSQIIDFGASTSEDGYKKTSELTDEDKKDEYQKNYQETTQDDGSYLRKSSEWTDKDNGEALITITGAQFQQLEETTCLYVATLCYSHGLTENIVVKNIKTLINYYDRVDFIGIVNTGQNGITDCHSFTRDSTEDEIRTYIRTVRANAHNEYPHYLYSIPPAIEEYLFGNKGDEYISEDNLINDPTAIYVSCDAIYQHNIGHSDTWGIDYATEKYFNFIAEHFEGRYFSMAQTSKQDENPTLIVRYSTTASYNTTLMNGIIGIFNPENYGQADLALSQESLDKWENSTTESINLPFADKKYAAQYSYNKDFEEAGVTIITNCNITDTVQDYYEITNVEATSSSNTLQTKVDGQKVSVEDAKYACGDEIVIKIYVKLRNDTVVNFDDFKDTNVGSATLNCNLNKLTVEPPKLEPTTSNYIVNYLEKGTNEPISSTKLEQNVAINTVVKATDEAIEIGGYKYDSADKETLTIGEGENVLNLYYNKRTDLSYKVNYLEKGTNNVISNQKVVGGQTFEDVITSANEIISIYGYNYDSADKDTLIIGEGENVINLYYTKKDTSILVHHYLENTTDKVPSKEEGKVVEDEIIPGKVNDEYSTNQSADVASNYELVATPTNATGTMTEEQIVVTYYYRLKEPLINSQTITKTATSKIENLTDEITYNISYKVNLADYIGQAEVTLVDTLPYAIDADKSDFSGGTYEPSNNTITWVETIDDINSYNNNNNDITINKTIKVVYKGLYRSTINIQNRVTGYIKTKTPEKEFERVSATAETITQNTVKIQVSKVWEDDGNKFNKRPANVIFKLTGSDGSTHTLEMASPGTPGTTTTQDSSNPNKWNDIFTNLPKYDEYGQEIVYTLTEEENTVGDLKYYDSVVDDVSKTVTNTVNYGKVTVHYYIMNTDGTLTTKKVPNSKGEEIQDEVIEGKAGTSYTTSQATDVSNKYELVKDATVGETNGTIKKYDEANPQEVIYYYRLKPSKVIVNYVEQGTDKVLADSQQITGYVDDLYDAKTNYEKETIEIDGKTYSLVRDSKNTQGIMTVEDTNVTYYYLQNTWVTIRYVERDPDTHKIVKDLEEPTIKNGLVGDEVVTYAKAFTGYKLVESPVKTTINLTKEEQTLIYYYEPVYTGLTENHIDEITGRVLFTEEHQVQVGLDYDIPNKEFEGYELVKSKLPDNSKGTMGEEAVTVNYYYIKKAVLEVNYIDEYTKKPIANKVVDSTKHEGDTYSTEAKTFENYDLVEVPANASGTMKVETDDNGTITNNKTVVNYYYKEKAVVEEHHIDIVTGIDLEEPTIYNGHVGDKYSTTSKEFFSYELITEDKDGNNKLPSNASGTITGAKVIVNYYYNQPAKVIVHYVEKNTGRELQELNDETGEMQKATVIIEGYKGDSYETFAKEFEYYTLAESPVEPNGKMKAEISKDANGNDIVNNTIELYYYYQGKPFNIGVEKEITAIIVNGERRKATNGSVEKEEIYRKDTENTSVQVEYKIKVINNGEIAGKAIIEDKLPEGMTLANSDGTWEVIFADENGANSNVTLRKVISEIDVGETKEYTLLLNWEQAGENMGEKTNIVKLVETANVPGFVDNNASDNESKATAIITVETGGAIIGITGLFMILVVLIGLGGILKHELVSIGKRGSCKISSKNAYKFGKKGTGKHSLDKNTKKGKH